MNPGCMRLLKPEGRRNADENVNQLFSWMTEMLEGSDIDEPDDLT